MAISGTNRLRFRAILLSREFKWLFGATAVAGHLLKAALPRRWLYRWLFTGNEGRLTRAGEVVLADLRDFTGAPLFDPDPLVMARRAGRREVFERIINYLNLDEATVQKIMQLDDGLGDGQ